MRRPLRNIEIFSMSVLDMFASALGAFIMICVILFPYFNQVKLLKQTREKIEQTVDQLGKVTTEVRHAEETSRHQQEEIQHGSEFRTSLVACQQTSAACKAAMTKTFLVVAIEWEERCDVDLYVTDPDSRKYYYGQKTFADGNSRAQLSLDMRDGPGIEIWQDPSAKSGIYKISYQTAGCAALDFERERERERERRRGRGEGVGPRSKRRATTASGKAIDFWSLQRRRRHDPNQR